MDTFEVEIWPSRSKRKIVYITSLTVLFLCVVGIILSLVFWDDYVETRQRVLTGTVVRVGWPVTVYWWCSGLSVFGIIAYGMLFFATDRKYPSLAVNKEGVLVNQQGFKRAMIKWDEIEQIDYNEQEEAIDIRLKNPELVIKRMPAMMRPFLKHTYVKERSPIHLDNKFTDGMLSTVAEKAKMYHLASQV